MDMLARRLRKRLNKYAKDNVGEYQGGFRIGRGTTDQIITLKQIQSTSYEQRLDLYILFVDYKQALDTVICYKLYNAMPTIGIPKKLIMFVKMTLENTKSRVVMDGNSLQYYT